MVVILKISKEIVALSTVLGAVTAIVALALDIFPKPSSLQEPSISIIQAPATISSSVVSNSSGGGSVVNTSINNVSNDMVVAGRNSIVVVGNNNNVGVQK